MKRIPVLYSFRRCPYAMRARLALSSSEQEVELREVVLRDKPAAMIEASPKATVPVLIDDTGSVLEESLDIMLWALRRNDPEKWLTPQGAKEDTMLAMIRHMDGPFKTALDAYKYAPRPSRKNPDVDQTASRGARNDALIPLQELEKQLRSKLYLFGDEASLADMAIAPFIRQFANVDFDWFSTQPLPAVQRWLAEFVRSDRFNAVMHKYKCWQPGEDAVVFPAERHEPGTAQENRTSDEQ